MIAIENSRWKATAHGLRSVSTVMPPSTACAGTLSPSQRASRRSSRRPERQALTNVAIAIAVSTKVRVRLPNSIAECTSRAPCGVKELPWQRGQVGQPSPEPVSRTAPPVSTMPMLATRVAQPRRRSQVRSPSFPSPRLTPT